MKSEAISNKVFSAHRIPYGETGFFSKIMLDYLEGVADLSPFYGRRPELKSFGAQMESKANFEYRDVLVSALKRQYGNIKSHPKSIEKLANSNAYTVTTGHQICLFTGPLYVIYKIATAIKTCEALKKEHPDSDFIPIFWMATEDHDFEEANHFYLGEKKIEWESGQGGAVGRMKPTGMDELAELLKESLGMGYHSGELIALFNSAYLNHGNIADATRYLIHALFGDKNVVCIDGDDPDLKRLAIPIFEKELKENFSSKAVAKTNEKLKEHYDLQVHSREINLFYLGEELRERIIRNEAGNYEVLNTRISFTESEIQSALQERPENFSPNVILRPLYQEAILPNLAYIGGGGELAYWFQLKEVFDVAEVSFPILMLRNSALISDSKSTSLIELLGLEWRDVFSSTHLLEKQLVKDESSVRMNLDMEREKMEMIFLDVESRLGNIEPTLQKSVRSGYARTDRIFKNLEKKMLRAEKKKQETLMLRIQSLKEALFPMDGLQERSQNFSFFYAQFGKQFIDMLIDELDPFDKNFTILIEES